MQVIDFSLQIIRPLFPLPVDEPNGVRGRVCAGGGSGGSVGRGPDKAQKSGLNVKVEGIFMEVGAPWSRLRLPFSSLRMCLWPSHPDNRVQPASGEEREEGTGREGGRAGGRRRRPGRRGPHRSSHLAVFCSIGGGEGQV